MEVKRFISIDDRINEQAPTNGHLCLRYLKKEHAAARVARARHLAGLIIAEDLLIADCVKTMTLVIFTTTLTEIESF